MSQTKLINLGIFGSYNKSSIGDSAILQGIIDQFKENLNHLTVFSFDPRTIKKTVNFGNIKNKVLCGSPLFNEKKVVQNTFLEENKARSRVKEIIRNNKILFKITNSPYRAIITLKNDFEIYYSNRQFWKQIKKEIGKLDLLLIGGGNLIMDFYSSWPIYPLIYTLLAKKVKTPVMLYAIGAGPINSLRAKIYFKIICHLANKITTRDKDSLKEIKKLGIKHSKITVSADPAICIKFDKRKLKKIKIIKTIKKIQKPPIGITVVPYFDKRYWPTGDVTIYKKYVKKMSSLVDEIVIRLDRKVLFFTTNFPNDLLICYDIYRKATQKDKIFIIEDRLTVEEIISVISSCDIVIGTRLHSLILSYITLTPFLAFGYQPKVHSFCKQCWFDDFFIPLDRKLNFSTRSIINKLILLLNQTEKYKEKMKRKIFYIKNEANISRNIALKRLRAN